MPASLARSSRCKQRMSSLDPSQISLADATLFWSMATHKHSRIAPRSRLNHWFEERLLRETSHGDWVLNRRHPQFIACWKQSFHLVLHAMFLYRVSSEYLFLGMIGDPLQWEGQDLNVLAIRDVGVEREHGIFSVDIFAAVSLLNQGLSHVPRSKSPPRILLQMHDPRAIEPPQDWGWKQCEVLHGNTLWFSHRHTYTGLALEPKLAYCYAKAWTPAAVDILLTTSDEHLQVFWDIWRKAVFPNDLLNRTRPGLALFLQAVATLVPDGHHRVLALKRWLEDGEYPWGLALPDVVY